MKRTIALSILAACMLIPMVGCKKKVQITFTNTTNQRLAVNVSGPGKGTGYIGDISGPGGQLTTRIEVDKDKLPYNYMWSAGPYDGSFPVNESTDKLYVDIPRSSTAGPRNENTEIIERKATTRTFISQPREVVTPDE